MSLNLAIEQDDEDVYEFHSFELVMHSSGNYLICEEGYFVVNGLGSFKPFDDQYVIINDQDDKFFITQDEFEQVKGIYLKYA